MSFAETLVILLVAVIVLGPKRLPEAARKLGHWMGVLRRASDEFKRQIMEMDQRVEDNLNSSTGELDHLLPTDEEWNQATDFGTDEVGESESAQELGAPPASSPDDLWDEEPVSGGLLPEKPEPEEAPAPTTEEKTRAPEEKAESPVAEEAQTPEEKTESSVAEKAQTPEAVGGVEAQGAEEVRHG